MAGDNNNSATSTSSSNSHQNATEGLIRTVISPQNQLITAHLEEDNYLLWKVQVETAIRGYGLEEFLFGTITVPPRFITDQ